MANTQPPIKIIFMAVDRFTKHSRAITQSLNAVSQAATMAGVALTAGFTVPAVRGLTGLHNHMMKVSEATNMLQANTGASRSEINKLTMSAGEWAKNTVKVKSEIISLQNELAKMGRGTGEIEKMFRPIEQLSVAVRAPADEVAKTVGNVMNVYGLGTQETIRVTDLMAASINNSAQGFEDFQFAMEHAAAPAKALNMSLEEMMTYNAMLANFGIRGSRVGAQFKSIMRVMFNPQKMRQFYGEMTGRSATGLMSVTEMWEGIAKATERMSPVQAKKTALQAFGRIGITGATAFIEDFARPQRERAWTRLKRAMAQADGAAGRMAGTMMQRYSGAFARLRNSMDALFASLSVALQGPITTGINLLSKAIFAISDLPVPVLRALAVGMGALAAAGPALLGLGVLSAGLATALPAINSLKELFATGLVAKTFRQAGAIMAAKGGGVAGVKALFGVLAAKLAMPLAIIAGGIAIVSAGWTTAMNILGFVQAQWAKIGNILPRGLAGVFNLSGAWTGLKTELTKFWNLYGPAIKAMAGVLISGVMIALTTIVKILGVLLAGVLRLAQVGTAIANTIGKAVPFSPFRGEGAEPEFMAKLRDFTSTIQQQPSEEQIAGIVSRMNFDAPATGTTTTARGDGEEPVINIRLAEGLRGESNNSQFNFLIEGAY